MIWKALTWPFVALAALAAIWLGGRKAGQTAVKTKALEARLKAVKEAEDVQNEVEALDRDTLRGRATVWVRKPKR
jgi:hypothetical protein